MGENGAGVMAGSLALADVAVTRAVNLVTHEGRWAGPSSRDRTSGRSDRFLNSIPTVSSTNSKHIQLWLGLSGR